MWNSGKLETEGSNNLSGLLNVRFPFLISSFPFDSPLRA